MTEFQSLYRKCKRAKKLQCSARELQKYINSNAIVIEDTINANKQINGFRITLENKNAFFPFHAASEYASDELSYLAKLRKKLNQVNIVVPPLISNGELASFLKSVDSEPQNINILMEEWYPTEFISRLYCFYYQENSLISPYVKIIKSSIEAFYFGLYSPSILTLLPCIEGVIRNIGMAIDVNCAKSVSVRDFLKILKELQKKIINDFTFQDYDWVPSDFKSIKFHDGFNEVIQIIENLKFVIANDFYAHTDHFNNETNLNRNGIVHGFITNFDDKSNFYRLITILNSLVFLTGYVGENVEFRLPNPSGISIAYTKKLNGIESLSRMVNKM